MQLDACSATMYSLHEFVDARLVDLGRTRTVFRGLGVLGYALGAVALCLAAARITGSWLLGLWGGALWVGAPNLAPMSIQYRPDVAHAILVVCIALLLGRAATARSLGALVAAATLIGLAVTVKVHALGLLVPLAAVAAFRPPQTLRIKGARATLVAWLRRRRAFAPSHRWRMGRTGRFVLNRGQAYSVTTSDVIAAIALLLGLAAGALVLSERAPHVIRVTGAVVAALCLGLLLPATASPCTDTLAGIAEIARTATGGGVNSYSGVETGQPQDLVGPLLRQTTVLFALAAIAAVIGWRRGDVRPAVWLLGATVLGAMALARLGTPHYFAPSFLLAVLGVAWLCSK